MDTEKDYFAILGVLPSIDDVALAAVYRALLKKYHPDVFRGSKADAERRTREIIEAYEVLGNPENRKAYDNLRSYRHEAQATSYSDEATADWEVVNNKTFYQKLIQVLLQSGFRLRATELYKDVSKDRGELGSVIRTGIRKVIAAVPPDFDQDGVQQHINKVREWAVGGLPQVYYLRALHSRSCGSGPTCTRGDHQVSKPVRQNTLEDTHGLRCLQRQISRCGDYASCVFRS